MKMTLCTTGLYAFFALLVSSRTGLAQTAVSEVTVSVALLKQHVYKLASDSLQGRETGTDDL